MMTASHKSLLVDMQALPSVDIGFHDLRYSVPAGPFSKVRKEILRGLSGKFRSGELTAIMGPSGAGKSSLLNILTGFQKGSGVKGVVEANGKQVDPGRRSSRRRSAYIMQDDQLSPLFSAREMMWHAAHLKIGRAIPAKAKALLVEDVLVSLGLADCATTLCARLSGGQRKRLSIALELLDNPAILFLDEPTSGLDSSSSLQMVSLLKRLAHEGRTVVCTLHQPSATLFELLDLVYVVADGRCLYQGSAANVIPFLASVNLPCPKYHNPADFMMDVVCGEFGYYTDRLIVANDHGWRGTKKDQMKGIIQVCMNDKNYNVQKANRQPFLISDPSEWSRYRYLVPKIFTQFHRDWTSTYLKVALHIAVAVIVGLMFQNYGNDASRVISNLGYLFIVITYLTFTSLMPAALKFPAEIKVIRKENFNNWYTFRTYFLAFMTVNIPIQLIFSLIFTCITYLITGQSLDPFRFSFFLGTAFALTAIAEFFGVLMGTCANPVNGVFNGSIVLAVMILLSGFLAFLSHMSRPLYYVSFLAFFRYSFELMAVSLYGWKRPLLNCPDTELYCHLKEPSKVLVELGLAEENVLFDSVALVGYLITIAVVAYIRLRHRLKQTV